MKVKAYVQFAVVLIRVSMTRELNCYAWLSTRSFLSLKRHRVVPLYREVDAQRLSESRPAHTNVTGSVSTKLALQYKLIIWRLIPLGLKSPLGLGPSISLLHEPPSSCLLTIAMLIL